MNYFPEGKKGIWLCVETITLLGAYGHRFFVEKSTIQHTTAEVAENMRKAMKSGIQPESPWPRRSRLVTEYPEKVVPDMQDIPGPLYKPPKEVSNCSICQWKEGDCRPYSDKSDHLLSFYMCQAQGLEDAGDCYNSDECKALFQPEKEKE